MDEKNVSEEPICPKVINLSENLVKLQISSAESDANYENNNSIILEETEAKEISVDEKMHMYKNLPFKKRYCKMHCKPECKNLEETVDKNELVVNKTFEKVAGKELYLKCLPLKKRRLNF